MTDIRTDISTGTSTSDTSAATTAGCSCCTNDESSAATPQGSEQSTEMTTGTYIVTGMTCGHCVTAVSTELGKLAGVSNVDVDLATGAVSVTSATPLVRADVAAAVEEAGYELAENGVRTAAGQTG